MCYTHHGSLETIGTLEVLFGSLLPFGTLSQSRVSRRLWQADKRARSSFVAVGSHAGEKHLFLNVPRKRLMGSLSGKKLCNINERPNTF
jgi:hypothetical protein